MTAVGDVMLALNAHIRRDNPIRAVEQTEGVLRVAGEMPAASGKPDHERVNVVLQNAMDRDARRGSRNATTPRSTTARRCSGRVLDPDGLYSIIAAWREESWRNAEQLRHARAAGGVDGPLYQAKLAADRGGREGRRGRDSRGHAHRPRAQRRTQRVLPGPRLTPRPQPRMAGRRGARQRDRRA